jgi:predicted nucleotidyltransferase
MEWLADRLAEVQGVVAVALGGSRAQGTERPDSDWDFGLYYEDTIDPDRLGKRRCRFPSEMLLTNLWLQVLRVFWPKEHRAG